MWVLIVFGILLFYFIHWLGEQANTNSHAFTQNELEQMSREMVGKSKRDASKVVKKYTR